MPKDKLLHTVKNFNMLESGDVVLVGVSGGADSVCLLKLLKDSEAEFNITVCAAHLNHGIRGAEADRDEEYVRELCERLCVPLFVKRVDIPAIARVTGESTELCARRERYDFFESIECTKIATAHTASDNIETMLMNMTRGSTLHGLAGIPPKRGKIIRPLIDFFRYDTENYCNESGLPFVIDSTNLSDEYTRNKFRHELIPTFQSINSSFEANACRLIESLRSEDDYINSETEKYFSLFYAPACKILKIEKLVHLHQALRCRIILKYISVCTDSDPERRHIIYIDEHLTKEFSLTLPKGMIISGKSTYIHIKKAECREKPDLLYVPKQCGARTTFGDFTFEFILSDKPVKNTEKVYCLDFDSIDDNVTVRSRADGDRMALAHRGCTKTLKKLFNEAHVKPEERLFVPVFSDSRGIIAVGGFGADASRLPNKSTVKFLIIKTERDKNE